MNETIIKTINSEKENLINEDVINNEIELKLPNGVYILHDTLGIKTVERWNQDHNEGVIGILLIEGKHQIIVATEDAPVDLYWSKKRELVNRQVDKLEETKTDFNGEYYCQKLNSSDFPAAYYCKTYNKCGLDWYLPSSGELWLIYKHLDEIQNALSNVGGQKLVTTWDEGNPVYWSSTEAGHAYAWYLHLGEGILGYCLDKVNNVYKVRPVSKFNQIKNLKELIVKKKDSSNYHSHTSEQSMPSVNISLNDFWRNIIDVYRKDGSVRKVSIMKDRNTGKFCFVNLTSSHVCKCRFDTFGDAIEDLMTREEVEYFDIHYAKDPIIE